MAFSIVHVGSVIGGCPLRGNSSLHTHDDNFEGAMHILLRQNTRRKNPANPEKTFKQTPLSDTMNLSELPLPDFLKRYYAKWNSLTPVQEKAVQAGLLKNKSLLVCAPTASGKTLIATMAIAKLLGTGKAIYIVPLKALANEKYKEYQELLNGTPYRVIMSTGDVDSDSPYLSNYDLIILTSEKLDSLLRHKISWLGEVKTVIIDEIHLLNDASRGPTLEVVITLLKALIKPQIIGLSATIGNPEELAGWLEAELVIDHWRPVELKQGIAFDGKTEFFKTASARDDSTTDR